jgi:hypothetical protein
MIDLDCDQTNEEETMAARRNCWEFKQCGREPGGERAAELGVCPAALDASADELNGGKNGGRLCWAIGGTLCGGKVQGEFAQKVLSCLSCDFHKLVREEEGTANFLLLKPGQKYKPPIR